MKLSNRQITALWTLFAVIVTGVLVYVHSDEWAISLAVVTAAFSLAGIMEIYQ